MSEHSHAGEQHFLRDLVEMERLFDRCAMRGRPVLEIGVGDGALTRLLSARGAKVVGYEIDPSVLPEGGLGDADVRVGDVTKTDLSFLSPDWACVSAPPYDLLPWLLETLDAHGVADAVLMASRKKAEMLRAKGFRDAFVLDGSAFEPASTGVHHVLVRGFG